MDDDQQFCLRWNNHQSTLISVFDTLLENGTLVDCTLAAEGKFLKAHKVVLSACSPYFATLLSQQYDKHPIFILKDVKFQELRAMMDYMYRGEVNISQDQLAALLKAAESLQIKGLSDSRGGASSAVSGSAGICASQKSDHKALSVPVTSGPIKSNSPSGGYTIEQKRPRHAVGASSSIESQAGSREGSSSPTSRKRKRIRRRSMDNLTIDNHEHSNSSSQSMQINSSVAPSNTSTAMGSVPSSVAVSQAIVTQQTGAVAGTSGIVTAGTNTGLNVTKKTDSVSSNAKLEGAEQEVDNDNGDEEDESGKLANMRKEQNKRKQHTSDVDQKDSGGEILIEPKSEYDDGNDETVEDLTLDDEELLEDLEQAGPSHGGGEGSSQGYAQWQVERSQDDVFMATQESAGQQRDPQGTQMPSSNTVQYARIRVKNWLMMTDHAVTGKEKDTNHIKNVQGEVVGSLEIKDALPNEAIETDGGDACIDGIDDGEKGDGDATTAMGDMNDESASELAGVTMKIERTSPSPSTNTAHESNHSEGNADFSYDIKISSPISWAFEPIKTEKSLMSDVTTTVYAAVKKSRKSSSSSPTVSIRSKPRILQSQSGTNIQSMNSNANGTGNTDKRYRILFQNSRIRKESLEHSDDMIYNGDYEKPWICRNCNRNYKWKNSLKCHLKNECGQPPRYFCNKMCGYRTNVHSNLKRHLNTKCRSKDDQ